MIRRTLLTIASFAALGAAIFTLTTRAAGPSASGAPTSPYTWFAPLVDVERIIADRYVEAPDLPAMQRSAIDGMIEALDDPYTEFIPTASISDFDKQVRGRYVGVGASVVMEDGAVTIVSPLDDSPAFHAGMMAGDKIVAIDGVSALGMTIEQTVDLLSGEPGSSVVVTVRRGDQTLDLTIVRRQIVTRTVSGWKRIGEKWNYMIDPAGAIGYARLSQFTATSPEELHGALESMLAQGMKGFILDLRFNPGGLFAAATQIADFFIADGLIVKTKGRAYPEQPIYATREGTLPNFPMIVLLNRQSASASEVLAGALRDNTRATIVGTRSFGKGVMQNIIPLPSGAGQLKITEQHYYGPSGKKIHRDDDSTDWGVDPSEGFFVPMTDAEYNAMLLVQRDNAIIRDALNAAAPTPDPASEWITNDLKDPQLASAVTALIGKLQDGVWKPASDKIEHEAVELAELGRMQEAHERILRDLDRVERRIKALASVAPEDQLPDTASFVPEGTDLTGGTVVLKDAAGGTIATLRITAPGIERWLLDAPVEKAMPDDTTGGEGNEKK